MESALCLPLDWLEMSQEDEDRENLYNLEDGLDLNDGQSDEIRASDKLFEGFMMRDEGKLDADLIDPAVFESLSSAEDVPHPCTTVNASFMAMASCASSGAQDFPIHVKKEQPCNVVTSRTSLATGIQQLSMLPVEASGEAGKTGPLEVGVVRKPARQISPGQWLLQAESGHTTGPLLSEYGYFRLSHPSCREKVIDVPVTFGERLDALQSMEWAVNLLPQVGFEAHKQKLLMQKLIAEKDESFQNTQYMKQNVVRKKGMRRSRPWEEARKVENDMPENQTIHIYPQGNDVVKPQPMATAAAPGLDEYGFRKISRKGMSESAKSISRTDNEVSSFERRRRGNRESARKSRMRKHAYLESLELAVKDGDLFRTIVENAADMISVHNLDPGATFRYVSPSYSQRLGWAIDEMIGLCAYAIAEEDDHEQVALAHQCSLLDSRVCRVVLRMKKKGGGHVWVESTATLTPHGIIAISRDISEPVRPFPKETQMKAARENAQKCKASDLVSNKV